MTNGNENGNRSDKDNIANNFDKPVGKLAGWSVLAKRIAYSCPWFRVRVDSVQLAPDKTVDVNANLDRSRKLEYSFIEHPGAVFVVPVTQDKKFVLIRSYRYAVDDWCWEVPSGGIGDKKNLPLEQIAREEMQEEAGCEEGTLENLGWYYTANGVLSLKANYFVAWEVHVTGQNHLEVGETIDRIQAFSQDEIEKMIAAGQITDGESAFALLLAFNRLAHRLGK